MTLGTRAKTLRSSQLAPCGIVVIHLDSFVGDSGLSFGRFPVVINLLEGISSA